MALISSLGESMVGYDGIVRRLHVALDEICSQAPSQRRN